VSTEERNAWAMLVLGVFTVSAYVVLVLASADGAPIEDVNYQPIMLWVIGIAIVIGIAVAITNAVLAHLKGEPQDADERDKAISRFGTYISQAFLVIGGLAALLMAMAEWDWFWIANTLFFGFALSGILEGVAKVTAYRRGLPW
jgi:MFS family permease